MVSARQIRSGERQSWHFPSAAQGVFIFKRCAFLGAAVPRVRLTAAARSGASLFSPHTKQTLSEPYIGLAEKQLSV